MKLRNKLKLGLIAAVLGLSSLSAISAEASVMGAQIDPLPSHKSPLVLSNVELLDIYQHQNLNVPHHLGEWSNKTLNIGVQASSTELRHNDGHSITDTTIRASATVDMVRVATDGHTKEVVSFGIEQYAHHDASPVVSYRRYAESEEGDIVMGASYNTFGPQLGAMAFKKIHEGETLAVSLGFSAILSEQGHSVGPAVEVVGKNYGVAVSATSISVVERRGEFGQYRNRYSLNPIVMLLQTITGQRSAISVLADALKTTSGGTGSVNTLAPPSSVSNVSSENGTVWTDGSGNAITTSN